MIEPDDADDANCESTEPVVNAKSEETADQAEPAENPIPKIMKPDAAIYWYQDEASTTPSRVDTCKRSTWSLLQHIKTVLQDENVKPEDVNTRYMRITVGYEPDESGESAPAETIVEGTLAFCIKQLIANDVTPEEVVTQFQRMCEFMSTRSSLKGVIVTAVFDEASVGGFGFLSMCSEVTDADILALQAGAAGQAELFKTSVKRMKPDLVFNDDEPKLILPSRFAK